MKEKLFNRIFAGALVISSVIPLAGSIPAYAEASKNSGWVSAGKNWIYYDDNGEMDKDITLKDECKNECVLNSDGVLTNRESPELFAEEHNADFDYIKTTIEGNDYFINKNGEKKTGWYFYSKDNRWYYANKHGIVQKNKTIISNNTKSVLGDDGAYNN